MAIEFTESVTVLGDDQIVGKVFSGPPLTDAVNAVEQFRDIHRKTCDKYVENYAKTNLIFMTTAKGVNKSYQKGEIDKLEKINLSSLTQRVILDESNKIICNEHILQIARACSWESVPYVKLQYKKKGQKLKESTKAVIAASLAFDSGALEPMDKIQMVGLLFEKYKISPEDLRAICTPPGAERLCSLPTVLEMLRGHGLLSRHSQLIMSHFPNGQLPAIRARLDFILKEKDIRTDMNTPEREAHYLKQVLLSAKTGEKRFQDNVRKWLKDSKVAKKFREDGYFAAKNLWEETRMDLDENVHPEPHLAKAVEMFEHELSDQFLRSSLRKNPRGRTALLTAQVVSYLIDKGGLEAVRPTLEILQLKLGDHIGILHRKGALKAKLSRG